MNPKAALSWRSALQKRRYSAAMDRVERRLSAVSGGYPGRLSEACHATLDAGGKRVRPLLTLLCARRDRELLEPVVRAAASVEMLHMATLLHDDILDHAVLRRGRATVAHEFGSETAVSTGNYLLARAFSELVGAGDPGAVDVLSAAALGLAEGELLQRDGAFDVELTVADYERRCERKTADLFAAACRLGSMLGAAGQEAAGLVAEYGRLVGLGFQVFDDILDFEGDETRTGKRVGTDVRDGTITLPMILAMEERPGLAAYLARRDADDAWVAAVVAEVRDGDALGRARSVAMGYIERARGVLDECPDVVERGLLAQVATQVVDRFS